MRRAPRPDGPAGSTTKPAHPPDRAPALHRYRSHTCSALRESHVGETVRLSGWIHRRRDHGQLVFIDLRDHYGITQCVRSEEHTSELQSLMRISYAVFCLKKKKNIVIIK